MKNKGYRPVSNQICRGPSKQQPTKFEANPYIGLGLRKHVKNVILHSNI